MAAVSFETERLLLRPFEERDLADIHEQVYSDPDVCRYYCGRTRTLQETADWLHFRRMEAVYSDFYAWAVELKDSGKVIGLVRLGPYVNDFPRINDDPQQAHNPIDVELSFAFGQDYWGQGYALEACHPIIDHAFETMDLARLCNGIHRANKRSVRFHEKLGYQVLDYRLDNDFDAVLENPGSGTHQRVTTS